MPRMSLKSKIHNEGPKLIALALWYAANIIIFVVTYIHYNTKTEFFYLRLILGWALPAARASAACLNFNIMLVLLPVCRNILSLIKTLPLPPSRPRRWFFRVLDKHITFHRTVGQLIGVFTLIHILAHSFNIQYFVEAWQPSNATGGLLPTLSALPSNENGTWINPVRTPKADPSVELWKMTAGYTGVVVTLSLILIYCSSTEIVRRYVFEFFWLSHHVFVLFLVGLVFHGMQGVVRSQSNVARHDPTVCYKFYASWGVKNSKCPVFPEFQGGSPATWKWLLAPVILYVIERIVRFVRSFKAVEVVSAKLHKSNVLEINLHQTGFSYQAGQYIFLKCPSLSHIEWHPFTLTSAPDETNFSVHIRCVGDWTNGLQKMFKQVLDAGESNGAAEGQAKVSREFPRLAVDGPFGSPAEDCLEYPANVLIGGGIGVTPFVSILRHIWCRLQSGRIGGVGQLQKVHFFWLCPDHRQFEWFTEYLNSLERQLADLGKPDFLDLKVYLTRGWMGDRMREIVVNEFEERDCFTGLQSKTHFGRPDWQKIFAALAVEHAGSRVGVFFCGPSQLSSELHIICNKHSDMETGVKFYYNKENF